MADANPALKKTAIVFGGNCEEGIVHKRLDGQIRDDESYKPTNKFLPEMSELSAKLIQNGWETKVLYDSSFARCLISYEDPRCEKKQPSKGCCEKGIDPQSWNMKRLIDAGVPAANVDYGSKVSLLASLNATADLIKLEPKGIDHEVMLMIDTHGQGAKDNKAHGICLSNGELLAMDDPGLIAALKKLKASTHGRLAVMDDSCFGGGTIPALSNALGPDTCILASQSSQYPSSFGRGLNNYLTTALSAPGNSVSAASVFRDAVVANYQVRDVGSFHQPEMAGMSDFDDLVVHVQAATYRSTDVDQATCKADPIGIQALTQIYSELKKVDPENTCYQVSEDLTRVRGQFADLEVMRAPYVSDLAKPGAEVTIDLSLDPDLANALPFLAKAFQSLKADHNHFRVTVKGYQQSISWSDFMNYQRERTLGREYEFIAQALAKEGVPNIDRLLGKLRTLQREAVESQIKLFQSTDDPKFIAAKAAQATLDQAEKGEKNLLLLADDSRTKLNHCLTEIRLKEFAAKSGTDRAKACAEFKFN
jgi:hypothetical protein